MENRRFRIRLDAEQSEISEYHRLGGVYDLLRWVGEDYGKYFWLKQSEDDTEGYCYRASEVEEVFDKVDTLGCTGVEQTNSDKVIDLLKVILSDSVVLARIKQICDEKP